jgi:flagellar basal-body rod protein FlgF
MIRGLYTAASGMITRQFLQENLSNNIANVNTPGYKKDKVTLKSFEEVLIQNRDKYIGDHAFKNNLGNMEFGVGIGKMVTDFSQGIVEETGRSLDFALEDENSFFTVIDIYGNKRYTRDGRFKIVETENKDGSGYLVNSLGYKVLGSDSNPIVVYGSDIKLENDGTLSNTRGNVRFYISRLEKNTNGQNYLLKDEGNLFRAASELNKSNGKVKQGALEKSNVDPLEAITEMISIMRSFESNQKVIQQMDETLGKTVNDVGSVR